MAAKIVTQARMAVALKLRAQGYSLTTIAKHMGTTAPQVEEYIRRALAAEAGSQTNKDVLDMELHRLDRMVMMCYKIIRKTDDPDTMLKTMDRLLKVQQRRSEYIGLDHGSRDTDNSLVDEWLNGVINPGEDDDDA